MHIHDCVDCLIVWITFEWILGKCSADQTHFVQESPEETTKMVPEQWDFWGFYWLKLYPRYMFCDSWFYVKFEGSHKKSSHMEFIVHNRCHAERWWALFPHHINDFYLRWKHKFWLEILFFFFIVISFKIYYCDLNTKCTANNFPLFWPAPK